MADYPERAECDFSLECHYPGQVSRVTPADRQRAHTKAQALDILRSAITNRNPSNQEIREAMLIVRKLQNGLL